MALPRTHEETAPAFHHYGADAVPIIEMPGARIALIAGAANGLLGEFPQSS